MPGEHNLPEPARTCLGEEMPEAIRQALALLNPHDTAARYVDAALGRPANLYDRSFAETTVQEAAEVLSWLTSRFSN